MSDSLYWFAPDKGAVDFRALLAKTDRNDLERMLFNARYNDFCSARCDVDDDKFPHVENGKRIPYMGWFWRSVNFYDRRITIGFRGGYVGFMGNNKWDHDERDLSAPEVDKLMGFLDAAMQESRKGGDLAEIVKNVNGKLDELRAWMQTLPQTAMATAQG